MFPQFSLKFVVLAMWFIIAFFEQAKQFEIYVGSVSSICCGFIVTVHRISWYNFFCMCCCMKRVRNVNMLLHIQTFMFNGVHVARPHMCTIILTIEANITQLLPVHLLICIQSWTWTKSCTCKKSMFDFEYVAHANHTCTNFVCLSMHRQCDNIVCVVSVLLSTSTIRWASNGWFVEITCAMSEGACACYFGRRTIERNKNIPEMNMYCCSTVCCIWLLMTIANWIWRSPTYLCENPIHANAHLYNTLAIQCANQGISCMWWRARATSKLAANFGCYLRRNVAASTRVWFGTTSHQTKNAWAMRLN